VKVRFYPLIFLLAGIAVCSVACGKKAPPIPRSPSFTAAVRNLTAGVEKGRVVLKGETCGKSHDLKMVSGCLVETAWYGPEEKPCQGCPLDYRAEENVRDVVAGPDGFSCSVPWNGEKGIHYFRIRLMGPGGKSGPPSTSVSIESEE
jgi:hypothetical protein